jgi:hypothetical protein
LSGFRLTRHAIGGVYRRAEDVAIFEHHGSEVAADANRDRLPFNLQFRVHANVVLHAAACV